MSEAEIIFSSTVEIQRTAKLRSLNQLFHIEIGGFANRTENSCSCHLVCERFNMDIFRDFFHDRTLATECVCRSAITWKWAPSKFFPGTLCELCATAGVQRHLIPFRSVSIRFDSFCSLLIPYVTWRDVLLQIYPPESDIFVFGIDHRKSGSVVFTKISR